MIRSEDSSERVSEFLPFSTLKESTPIARAQSTFGAIKTPRMNAFG